MDGEIGKWRILADSRITPIEGIKTEIRVIREFLDQQFPSWERAYATNPVDYMSHEARREYFVTLRVILQNAQLGFIYIRDHLTNEQWWSQQGGVFSKPSVLQALREHALMIKFFTFHATATATEETCRAIVRADPTRFGIDPNASFCSMYQRLLKLSQQKQYEPLFDILRLTRNTIHTNGVYRPEKSIDRTISYGSRVFEFEVGKILKWMGDDFPEWLARELSIAMKDLVVSPIVAQVPHCPRGN